MNYLQTLLVNLKKEVPYQWRIQSKSKDKTKAICSAYIDARDVMSILDKYCEFGWHTEVKEIAGFIFYGIGVNVPLSGDVNEDEELVIQTMWRWDTGSRIENDPQDQMYEQAGKSAASDSFKRAAIHWGVGRFLYDLPTVTLPCDNYNVLDNNGQKVWDLTKHINNMKGKNTTQVVSPEPPTRPQLSQEAFDSMVKYITDGRVKDVENGIKKYTLSEQQKTLLTSMINQEKSKSITASAKKK